MTKDYDLIDALRIAVISLACLSMLLMAAHANRARVVNGDRFAVLATAALLIAMLFVVIVEARQVGEPLKTWWGLPMLSAITLLTLSALWRTSPEESDAANLGG